MTLVEENNKYYISGRISVMIARNPNGVNETMHKHDFIEIVYMLKGECVHTVDGKDYEVSHGDMLVINYNQTHSIRSDSPLVYVNILIKPEYVNESLANSENAFSLLNLSEFKDFAEILDKNKVKIRFFGDEKRKTEDVITSLLEEMKAKNPGHELYVRSQFNILLLTIFRKMSLNLESKVYDVSEELLDYIRSNCTERLTLNQLADMCSYNCAYFSRLFKEYAGLTFTQYLKKCRIERAKYLIETTNMKITDIAYEVGYVNKTKFFSHFKSVCSMSPLEYRKSIN